MKKEYSETRFKNSYIPTMGKTEKKINKRIVGAILWTTLLWLWWLSMTPKWRSFAQKAKDFIKDGLNEMKRTIKGTKKSTNTSEDNQQEKK